MNRHHTPTCAANYGNKCDCLQTPMGSLSATSPAVQAGDVREARILELEAENKALKGCPANREFIFAVEDICRIAAERMSATVKAALSAPAQPPALTALVEAAREASSWLETVGQPECQRAGGHPAYRAWMDSGWPRNYSLWAAQQVEKKLRAALTPYLDPAQPKQERGEATSEGSES